MTIVYLCPKCQGWMVFCFAIDYCEYVCPECATGEEYFNGCRRIEIETPKYDKFVAENRDKLIAIGIKNGIYVLKDGGK